ncbi:pyridoxine/pyridoxamine 5'-phosphate oxidase-like [Thrips palmi]|uniref:pyridoxal 5'-phosphate synthase n=1 Tax=Thrips palmi TaxID=161013 RepID=A0A6P8YVC0_THRPL|nr:pyridoxine/pyridoxamine 5'-phosphate oxidase-like [Thrips palmi]XP_034241102.1 pyridoxine/pyridoxamine 5'-phosphate oxidase-like [Thrips palmi]
MDAGGLCDRLRHLHVRDDELAGQDAVNAVTNPDDIFQRWRCDARAAQLVMPDSAIITTCSRLGQASARTVCLRRMDEGRFVFLTDSRSKKCRELAENPKAVVTFLWAFVDRSGLRIAREVRIGGAVQPQPPSAYEDLYWSLIPNRRIRAYICEQGAAADWDRLKERHDQLLVEVEAGKRLPMPAHFVAYELFPCTMEFYEQVEEEEVCQSLQFIRAESGAWTLEESS